MERMSERNQQYFAKKLLELSQQLMKERGGEEYMSALHPKKQEGLEKSESRKRWYDNDETLHQAFNNLYALAPDDRREVAARLTTPIMIVEAYEKNCQDEGREPDIEVVDEILTACLTEGQERAKGMYALYMGGFTGGTPYGRRRTDSQEAAPGFWSHLLKDIQGLLAPS